MFKDAYRVTVPGRQKSTAWQRAVALSSLLLLSCSSFAQNGPAPDYISSLSPFNIRALTGSYAPSNGNESMASITPSEWLTDDPSVLGLRGVLAAWSGGGKATTGTQLFVHGGGHSDSANNGMYIYDFGGQTNPTGWESPLVISGVSDVRSGSATYADGKPGAVHTYDGAVYASHNNHIYRFGGSSYSNGSWTNTAFKYNVATGEWTRLANYPGGEGAAKTIYDPITGKIFVTITNSFSGRFLRTSDDTWSSSKSFGGNGFPYDSMAAWDTSRNRAIIVGDGETSLVTVDFASESISVDSFSPTGVTEPFSINGISAAYDPVRDVFWMIGGPIRSAGYTNLYELRADGNPWSTARYSLSGDDIPQAKDLRGSWGRYVLMPQWGAIGLVASDTSPAFVIRLPDGQATTPESPDQLQVN